MAALRLPQHLADPPHVDSGEAHLRFELLEDVDGAAADYGRQVDAALAALREHDARGGERLRRRELVDRAADAVWRMIVQHEACDCCDHHELLQRHHVPAEVLARIGARSHA
ncbi:DUF6665 family protein [Phenylobacterium deserti]|uniref:Uncharacterized protein n=1 Tax=Phenylobacterium deserti TaxID=1914756 RepID=A0A328ANL6_9CAUL|nr:DUF6665 family protein [Phenylobacterium deserti]RAK56612.1 hypothetical protein DJ018_01125 [Phenylobacterium deserti]